MNVEASQFTREYASPSFRVDWDKVKFTGTSKEHQDMVYEICWWLYKNNIPFATEVRFKTGYRPDIIAPTHVKPIIEVRHSEDEEKTRSKFGNIPVDLHNKIIYVDASEEFDEKLIL